jgi:hypothetical protein
LKRKLGEVQFGFATGKHRDAIGMLKIISESTYGIDAHIEKNNILVNEQYGFRTHISTKQASYIHVDKWNSDCYII